MKRKMSLADAVKMVPDDLPDGAFWAMAHEIAGAEYGEVWDELDTETNAPESCICNQCGKVFKGVSHMTQHINAMRRNGKHT